MTMRLVLVLWIFALVSSSCRATTVPSVITGQYVLVEENGDPLPSDPFAPDGCCITLSGSIDFTPTTYFIEMTFENKNNGSVFINTEQGTYIRRGSTLTFTRTGGGGIGFPFLLAPGTISADEQVVTLLYGDEGPGSNQIQARFERAGEEFGRRRARAAETSSPPVSSTQAALPVVTPPTRVGAAE